MLWGLYGSRIIEISFRKEKENVTIKVIRYYIPANIKSDDKNQFYDRL